MSDILTQLLLKTEDFDRNLTRSGKSVNEFEQGISNFASKATGMMTKMAAGVGAGVGAYEALNKTIQSSQTLTDLFGSATEQAKSSVDSFFSALAQGDFSGFTDRISSAIDMAREFYAEMDRLGSISIFNSNEQQRIYIDIEKQKQILYDNNSTADQRASALAEIKRLEQELTSKVNQLAGANQSTYYADMRKILAENGATGDVEQLNAIIDEYLRQYDDYEAAINRFNALEKQRVDAMVSQKVRGPNGVYTHSQLFETEESTAIGQSDEYRVLRAIKEAGDEQLKNAKAYEAAQLAGEIRLQQTKTANLRKLSKYDENGNMKSGGGTTKKKVEVVPLEGSFAELDKQIADKKRELSLAVNLEDKVRIQKELDTLVGERRTMEIDVRYNVNDGASTEPVQAQIQKSFKDLTKGFKLPEKLERMAFDKTDVKNANQYGAELQTIASLMGSITNLTNSGASAWLSWASTVMTACATAIPAITAVIGAKKAEAVASGVASATQTPVVGWTLAGAAALSVLAALDRKSVV